MLRLKRSKLFYISWIVGTTLVLVTFFYFPGFHESNNKSVILNGLRLSNEIQSRLAKLEEGLKDNRKVLDELRSTIEEFSAKNSHSNALGSRSDYSLVPKEFGHCTDVSYKDKFNATIEEIFSTIAFDNPNGGAWKQGWEVKIDQNRWSGEKKLKVFVVPHSHNDPGWLKTFDQYLESQTRHILNNVLKKLSENPTYSFIWAETSFFAGWWEGVKSEDSREAVKTLLDNGQLEIVTGGWVMNDEANTHYSAMIAQMVDGHEFLRNTLNYTPRYGWAIDPFGLSPTMAFLLKKMGFKGMVIQRVHYSIKKYLAQNHLLEFKWRQFWETQNSLQADILCHVEPFYSYDIPHTCGPDPKVCCQFDFKRLPPTRVACPWKVPPQRITDTNVASRAALLVEQYKKKAMLYSTDSLLVPLGDDFRWDKLSEWDNQFKNYQKLFDYINSNKEMHMEIKWGTLKDYFESVQQERFPSLNGDFFTYADRDDNYWSGFYTTRPFHKSMDRMLESYVRSAEIIFSLGCIMSEIDKPTRERLAKGLTYARLNLDLFQHHDGITGTSKSAVVDDYSSRLFNSIQKCQEIITTLSSILLHFPKTINEVPLSTIDVLPNRYSLPLQDIMRTNQEQKSYFIAYNSLGMDREELICLAIPANYTNWIIRDPSGKMIEEVQISKVYDQKELRDDVYEACFIHNLKPLSLSQFTLEPASDPPLSTYEFGETILFNFEGTPSPPSDIELNTDKVKLVLSSVDGMIKKIHLHSGDLFKSLFLHLELMTYGTRKGNQEEKSGAYLFLPESSNAKPIFFKNPPIRITKGTIMSRVEVLLENELNFRHRVTIFRGQEFFDIENEFQMTKGSFDNKELLMRFSSTIKSDDAFYTDLNGLQMIKRKWYDKIPLQGNMYPLPSLAYIEDGWTRLSVLSAQPLGVTSRRSGILDVFLDRRLTQDDKRGVGQGITDNRRTRERFRVFVERKPHEPMKPSVKVQRNLLKLLNPIHYMQSSISSNQGELSMMPKQLPCDIHLLNLRTNVASFSQFHLFLHRFASSCEAHCTLSSKSFKLLPHLAPNMINALQPGVSSMTLSLLEEIKSNMSIQQFSVEMDAVDFSVFALSLK